ncbi:ImpA family metalloprotease, partial [Photobacterium damselae]
TIDPVEHAILTENHSYATEEQFLSRAMNLLQERADTQEKWLSEIYSNVNSITWDPTPGSIFIVRYNSVNRNTPILQANSNSSGDPMTAPLAFASQKDNGFKYVSFNANPFAIRGTGDFDIFLKNVIKWVTSSNSNLSIIGSLIPDNSYFDHFPKVASWFNEQYSGVTLLNEYQACDYTNLIPCIEKYNANLVILGSHDYQNLGYDGIKVALEYIEEKQIPLIIVHSGRYQADMLKTYQEKNGVFHYFNQYKKYTINSANVDTLKQQITKKPEELISSFTNKLFNIDNVCICTIFLMFCYKDAFLNAFRIGADHFRNDLVFFDNNNENIFSRSGNDLAKIILLLADKYRSTIDYPITHDDPANWFKAMFADWMVLYSRENIPQPDLGSYVIEQKQVTKESNAHYIYPNVTSSTKTISVPYPGQWTSTGWYALPGKQVTLTRNSTDEHDIVIQLYYGRTGTNHAHKSKMYRRPLELTTSRIKVPPKGSVTFSTPYGAPIYLLMKNGSGELVSTLTATGVAEHPTIMDFSDPAQIERFEHLLLTEELPHIDFRSEGAEQHLRRDRFIDAIGDIYTTTAELLEGIKRDHLDNVYSLAGYKVQGKELSESTPKDALNVCEYKLGADCTDTKLHSRTIIQHANYDQNAQCGVGCSGNPWDSSRSIDPRGWLDNHELGHNLQTARLNVSYATAANRNVWSTYKNRAGENSNNVFPYFVLWKSHYITDGKVDPVYDHHLKTKDFFYAYQSDASQIT